jgi:hypothetical protein
MLGYREIKTHIMSVQAGLIGWAGTSVTQKSRAAAA